jgi:hypothetical protein
MKVLVSSLLLFYTLLCGCFYDPVVSVDDTPRKPLFNEVVSPFVGGTLLTSRYKFNQPNLKLFTKIKFFINNKIKSLESLIGVLCFDSNTCVYLFHLIRHSINIRAPSL